MEITLSDSKKKIELELPVKADFKKKEYWIKESTKKEGIFMNSQVPFFKFVVEESDSVTISKKNQPEKKEDDKENNG